MRRILLVLTVAAIMAATLAISGGSAWAFNPQPDPPGSIFDGYEDVAIQDSEYDAVGIRDEENRSAYDAGYEDSAIIVDYKDEENRGAYGGGCDTIACSNNL